MRIHKVLVAAASATGLAIIGSMMPSPRAVAQNSPGAPVSIVSPIPVPVNVVTTAANPFLPVRDVDNPARQPYREVGLTSNSSGSIFFPPPPLGKRLVIEYVTIQATVPINQTPSAAIFTRDSSGAGQRNDLIMTNQGPIVSGTSNLFVTSQLVRLYSDSSAGPSIGIDRDPSTGTATIFASITGYLVDVRY